MVDFLGFPPYASGENWRAVRGYYPAKRMGKLRLMNIFKVELVPQDIICTPIN